MKLFLNRKVISKLNYVNVKIINLRVLIEKIDWSKCIFFILQ